MNTFAKGTSVPVDRSRAEIDKLLAKRGAVEFGYMQGPGYAQIGFKLGGHNIRVELVLPDPTKGYAASKKDEQRIRERWRALVLVLKAKFVAVDSGVSTFEEAFLADVVAPDGRRVAQHLIPQLADIEQSGPLLLTVGK